ncbi:MAG TPA: hypothetical protein VJ837_03130 [Candidatus Paceibacterota bacterium]|nr:hypothetical protein [Candidatus Paceibacterota bacterium]
MDKVGENFRRLLFDPMIDWRNSLHKGPKTIYLHIGAHKTGTSAIQSMLKAESRRLRWHGFFYERSFYDLGRMLKRESPLAPGVLERLRQEFHDRIDARPEPNIIGSSENFFGDVFKGYSNTRAVANDLRAILADYDVRIVASIRRQDEFVQSVYHQHVKQGGTMRFDAFVEAHDIYAYRWNDLLREYAEVFERSHLTVHCYEDVFLQQDRLLERVFESLQSSGFRTRHRLGLINPGLSSKGIEMAIRCNDLLTAEEHKLFRHFLQSTFHHRPEDDHSLLSPQQRQALMASYAQSNRRCIEEFVGHSPRSLEYVGSEHLELAPQTSI